MKNKQNKLKVNRFNIKSKGLYLFMFITVLLHTSCNVWQEDMQLNKDFSDETLSQVIESKTDLSKFNQILKLTGYDKVLDKNQSLSVFAPDNAVLNNMDLSDVEVLKNWVQNYVANLAYYTNSKGELTLNGDTVFTVEMLNGKYVKINANDITQTNIVCANGVLHIINNLLDEKLSILEYLNQQTGYEQVDFIKSMNETVMDMDRSIQTGVDVNGKPIYDTVWIETNTFLNKYQLGNEKQSYTVVLVDNSAFDLIKAKYTKYMYQVDQTAMKAKVMNELVSDLVLKPVQFNASGRFSSMNDVLVDIDTALIKETYHASNGTVYKISSADIKIYENKIKTQIIEGEDYTDRWDGQSAWTVRYRNWASGGKDAMLKGQTRWTFNWNVYYPENDSTAAKSSTKTFYYTGDTYVKSSSSNAYIAYNPTMYSCDYEIFWLSYDDVESHIFTIPDSTRTIPLTVEQKLLISFPGKPVLSRSSDSKILNNFSQYSTMAASSYAGIKEEKQLVRYRLNADNNTVGSSNEGIFLLDIVSDGVDAYGSGKTLICPTYGKATFFVSNTTRSTNAYAGMIFLDYIRLVPKVNVND